MLETVECSCDVAREGHVDNSLGVVPLESETAVETAGPVSGDGVLGAEAVEQMFGMFFANILDAKVVDNQTEGDGSGLMGEETWNTLGLDVSRGFQVLDEAVVSQDASLG